MPKNRYKARYLNALKKAAKVNRYLKKGYHLFYGGVVNTHGFYLRDDTLNLKLSDQCSVSFFINNEDLDNGYYTTISDWNREFNELIEIYKPEAKMYL